MEEGAARNSLHEVNIIPISKTNNTVINENCRQIVLMNIGAKSLTKYYQIESRTI